MPKKDAAAFQTLPERIRQKRGTWDLFQVVGDHDLSNAKVGHVDQSGLLWLFLPEDLLCTDGRHVIQSHAVPAELIRSGNVNAFTGFCAGDQFWMISDDYRLLSIRLRNGHMEDHTANLPSLVDAYWMWTPRHEDILIGKPGELIRYDGKRAVVHEVPRNENDCIHSATIAPNGDTWITSQLGFHRLTPDEDILYGRDVIGDTVLWDPVFDHDGGAWIATDPDGLIYFKDGEVSRARDTHGQAVLCTMPNLIDDENDLWFISHDFGTHCLNRTEVAAIPYEETPGLAWPQDVVQDKTRAFWFIGVRNGICRYDASTLSTLVDGHIDTCIKAGKDRILLVAPSHGILEYDGGEIKPLTREAPRRCHSLCIDSGDQLWLASRIGLSVFDMQTSTMNWKPELRGPEGIHKYTSRGLATGEEGDLWFTRGSSLFHCKDSCATECDLEIDESTVKPEGLKLASDGSLWITSRSKWRLVKRAPDGTIHGIARSDAVDGHVISLFEDNDRNMWIGTKSGTLLRCPLESVELEEVMNCGQGAAIQDIRIDGSGRFWLSTVFGLVLWDGTNTYCIGEDFHLPCRDVLATYELSGGRIAIVTRLGLCEYSPSSHAVSPEVFVAKAGGEEVHERPDRVTVHDTSQRLTVTIGAMNMKLGPLKYQTRLRGQEDDWTETWDEELTFEGLKIGTYTFEVRAIDQDLMTSGEPATLEIEVIPDPNVVAIDELQSELQQARDFATNIIESINDAIIVLNTNGTIETVNHACLDLLGYSLDEVTGEAPSSLFPKEEADYLSLTSLIVLQDERCTPPHESALLTSDGNSIPVLLSCSCMNNSDGELQGFVLVASNLSEFKKLQQQLLQSQKMESIGLLAGGVAHDFNNQLSGILGIADLMSDRLEDEESLEHVALIRKSARHAAELTRQLLAFGRKGKNLSAAVCMNTVIRDVIEILKRSIDKRIRIETDLSTEPVTTTGDPSQLQNAILNMAINARDAMPDGGQLTFETKIATTEEAGLTVPTIERSDGSCIRIRIADTGCGMDADTLKHIFEPFFTSKEQGKGTGMGLAGVYGTVENHRGAIRVSSEKGKGSTFNVYLPLVEGVSVEAEIRTNKPAENGTARILLIDDEDVILRTTRKMLKQLGYTVAACQNVEEAIALYADTWQETDLVILDMMMPEMSGRDAFAALKKINHKILAILSSGYSLDGEAQGIMDDGVSAFLGKPFGYPELAETVAQVLRDD